MNLPSEGPQNSIIRMSQNEILYEQTSSKHYAYVFSLLSSQNGYTGQVHVHNLNVGSVLDIAPAPHP